MEIKGKLGLLECDSNISSNSNTSNCTTPKDDATDNRYQGKNNYIVIMFLSYIVILR